MIELEEVEARVVGALVEKQLTTPQQYPLSLNALVLACNQTSSRHPVVSYDERTVEAALAALKGKGVLRFVHPSHGRSVTRYRQVLEEVLELDTRQLALVAVLLLRGPQTVGELRARTERMAVFSGLEQVEEELDALATREEALVVRLAREPGRKEERWAQLLAPLTGPRPADGSSGARAGAVALVQVAERERPAAAGPDGVRAPAPSLAAQVAVLQAEVAALRRDLDELIAQLRG